MAIAGGLCLLALAFCCRRPPFCKWQAEQKVRGRFLVEKFSNGSIGFAERPHWLNGLYGAIGIRQLVTSLDLDGKRINDDDLAMLASLPHLMCLRLDQCAITDEGVKRVCKMPTPELLGAVCLR